MQNNNIKIYMPNNLYMNSELKPESKDLYDNVSFFRNQSYQTLIRLYKKHNIDYLNDTSIKIDPDYANKIKVVIYAPPINDACGGAMVLYNLVKTINSLNNNNVIALIYCYDHRTYTNNFCNNFFNPFWIDDKTIVIYPETITGNPLMAKYVVRWILLDLGLEVSSYHYKNWHKNDIVYHWEPSFLKNTKQLVNIWINPKIQNYQKSKRDKNCYAFKKMQWIPDTLNNIKIQHYHSSENINIDSISIAEAIDVFNNSKLFYCYDPNTFFSVMAPLCGCVTVLHPLNNLSKEQYFKSRILCHSSGFCYDAGIAYGNSKDEISMALASINEAQDQFDYLCSLYQETVTSFMQEITKVVNSSILPINIVNNIYYSHNPKK